MSFLPSEITDLPAREKIRYSGSLNFTDRPAHVKYAYLRASSGSIGGPWAQRALRAPPAVVLVGVRLRWPERADRGGTNHLKVTSKGPE